MDNIYPLQNKDSMLSWQHHKVIRKDGFDVGIICK